MHEWKVIGFQKWIFFHSYALVERWQNDFIKW
jgi:hypothetical protein